MELKDSCETCWPWRSVTCSLDSWAIISVDTSAPALPQISTTLLYRSPAVTRPETYCCSNSLTSRSERSMMPAFCGGTSMSSMAIEMPARVARRKPFCSSLSANTTVAFSPHLRKETLIRREISFFLSALLTYENGRPRGRMFDSKALAAGVFLSPGVGPSAPLSLGFAPLGQAHGDAGSQFDPAGVEGALPLAGIGKPQALALAVDAVAGGVVQAEHHVLRRNDGWLARGRKQHVVRGQHQRGRFHLRFHRQRDLHRHLVAVEVGIERRADQRVQLYRLAFDQDRLERLYAQTVQRGRAVEHRRMLLDDLFQDVPDDRRAGFDLLLGGLDRGCDAHGLQAREDEGLEQFQRHQLGQTALVQLERRAYGNHRAPRVVDALAQQVLAETPALALDHVGQRLERALVGTGHGFAAAAVVQQRIDGFLQHALFVAGDDLRGLELQQTAQTAVAVDHAAIQVVQVGGGEA